MASCWASVSPRYEMLWLNDNLEVRPHHTGTGTLAGVSGHINTHFLVLPSLWVSFDVYLPHRDGVCLLGGSLCVWILGG